MKTSRQRAVDDAGNRDQGMERTPASSQGRDSTKPMFGGCISCRILRVQAIGRRTQITFGFEGQGN